MNAKMAKVLRQIARLNSEGLPKLAYIEGARGERIVDPYTERGMYLLAKRMHKDDGPY